MFIASYSYVKLIVGVVWGVLSLPVKSLMSALDKHALKIIIYIIDVCFYM